MIRLIIADDHHIVRQGLRALLEKHSHIMVIGEAQDGQETLDLVERLQPDVLLLDISMPVLNGIDVIRKMRDMHSQTQVVVLSMYSDESLVKKAFRSGAKAYLLKKSISADLLLAITAASQRKFFITPELKEIYSPETETSSEDEGDPFDRLTTRERQVCQLIAEGCTNIRISEQLHISVKTVEKHRANLMAKLGIDDMAGLIREAIRHGIVFLER